MNFKTSTAQILVSLAMVTVLAGCGASKQSQCKTLSASVNSGQELGKKFKSESEKFQEEMAAAGQKKDLKSLKESFSKTAASFKKFTGELDSYTKTVNAIDLKDEKLVGLKDRYAKNLTEFVSSIQLMASTLEKMSEFDGTPQGAQKLQTSFQDMQKAASQATTAADSEKKIISELNEYCGAK